MKSNHPIINWTLTAVLMMALWFLMSQRTEPKFLILGALSSIAIATVCLRPLTAKSDVPGREYYLLSVNVFRFIAYFAWLLVQIAKSAYYVSLRSLEGISIDAPCIVWFRADYDNPAARAMLANSITLTPGTITIDITDDGLFSVHALNSELAEGVLDGSMQRKVAWLYGENINFAPASEQDIAAASKGESPRIVRGIIRSKRRNA